MIYRSSKYPVLMQNPLSGGEKGFSLQGWVLPVSGQPTPTPLRWRGIIFLIARAEVRGQ